MAALTRRAILVAGLSRSSPTILSCNTKLLLIPERGTKYNKKPCQKPKKKPTVESIMTSIEAKGFLRPYKPYQPAEDVDERLDWICQSEGFGNKNETTINDLLQRFKLFAKCADEFQHSIPNSRLVNIKTIDDDRLFGGQTAFPESATLVTGLKYKKKYRGYKPEKRWPNQVHSVLKF
ncbi:hypothetical protein QAD02_022926 [Eretmocerus hayati]|uniref:Uncharacterized protein n=1 Tax=Eretmocerus hayati TaxID=131215 RepID=A0ACC2PXS1_9HYME|nr:hypothetical protein QAD02_022926 [Eretmocerus hayati]